MADLTGTVSRVFGAWYFIKNDQGTEYAARLAGRMEKYRRTTSFHEKFRSSTLATGDQVVFENNVQSSPGPEGLEVVRITDLLPRRNEFTRASLQRRQVVAANVDFVLAVATPREPAWNEGFLIRVLMESRMAGIESSLFINKADLATAGEIQSLSDKIHEYDESVSVWWGSALYDQISELTEELKGKTTLLIGQSGTGKSTLINCLLGSQIQSTGHLSSISKGRHTTVNPRLLSWQHGQILDIPGMREFGLQHRSIHDLALSFPGFANGVCRFRNCTHLNEPDCGIRERADSDPVFRNSYIRYTKIVESLPELHRPRRGDHRSNP